MNDALVPGTFGGNDMKLAQVASTSDVGAFEDRQSNNSGSYYQKEKPGYNKEGPSMSITGSDGMLSFNPSNLNNLAKLPSSSSI